MRTLALSSSQAHSHSTVFKVCDRATLEKSLIHLDTYKILTNKYVAAVALFLDQMFFIRESALTPGPHDLNVTDVMKT